MNRDGKYLRRLSEHARNNILNIGYDKFDVREENIKLILQDSGLAFKDIHPGNDLYSYKFEIEGGKFTKYLYVNYGYNLITQSEYINEGSCSQYKGVSDESEYPYLKKIINLGFIYVRENVLFSDVILDKFEESCRLSPHFHSVFFEDI